MTLVSLRAKPSSSFWTEIAWSVQIEENVHQCKEHPWWISAKRICSYWSGIIWWSLLVLVCMQHNEVDTNCLYLCDGLQAMGEEMISTFKSTQTGSWEDDLLRIARLEAMWAEIDIKMRYYVLIDFRLKYSCFAMLLDEFTTSCSLSTGKCDHLFAIIVGLYILYAACHSRCLSVVLLYLQEYL